MNDERYAYGSICTWHGPASFAARGVGEDPSAEGREALACPFCGLPLNSRCNADAFWATVTRIDAGVPQYLALMRWSEGLCFQDFDTLQNAFWQAMAGETRWAR